jgi:hypothetical protein
VADHALFVALVQEQYDTDALQLLFFADSTNAERTVYRVDHSDGSAWIVRAYRHDIPVPDWLGGCGTRDTHEWLLTRAATLVRLAHLEYPAPRVIPTSTGALVGETQGWCTLATTFIEGTVVRPTLA